jgi:molecular chaperone DnaK (HSP70)
MIVTGVSAIGGRLCGDRMPVANAIQGVLPITLGIKLPRGYMKPLFSWPNVLPARVTEAFSTVSDNQHSAKIEIFQDCNPHVES